MTERDDDLADSIDRLMVPTIWQEFGVVVGEKIDDARSKAGVIESQRLRIDTSGYVAVFEENGSRKYTDKHTYRLEETNEGFWVLVSSLATVQQQERTSSPDMVRISEILGFTDLDEEYKNYALVVTDLSSSTIEGCRVGLIYDVKTISAPGKEGMIKHTAADALSTGANIKYLPESLGEINFVGNALRIVEKIIR